MRGAGMSVVFWILAAITVLGGLSTVTQKNTVHCALALTAAFAGLALLFLQLDAQFIGFAQILVYVGAVAILIVFAILLTRGTASTLQSILSPSWAISGVVSVVVFAVLAWTIRSSAATRHSIPPQPEVTVKQIG